MRPTLAVMILGVALAAASAVLAAQPNNRPLVVFLGDSLTAGAPWAGYFPEVRVLNEGISGDTTEGLLSRLKGVIRVEPDRLFLMAGVNDLGLGAPISQIVWNHKKIITDIRKGSPRTRVFLLSVLPVRNERLGDRIDNLDIRELNRRLEKAAEETGAGFIDLFPRFLTDYGQLDARFTIDGVHLNMAGYEVWRAAIEAFVNGRE